MPKSNTVFDTSYYAYQNAVIGYTNYDYPIIPNKKFDALCGILFIEFLNLPKTLDQLNKSIPLISFKILDKVKLDYARIKYGI